MLRNALQRNVSVGPFTLTRQNLIIIAVLTLLAGFFVYTRFVRS
jgi:hypothetical protein